MWTCGVLGNGQVNVRGAGKEGPSGTVACISTSKHEVDLKA
jgi:hypothetical protein